jgi:uncharacterized RDD family membrane protein YckC
MWWYAGTSGRMGPVAENDLIGLVQRGVVSGPTLVWREGMENWQALAEQPQFTALFSAGAPRITAAPILSSTDSKPATWSRYFARAIDMWVIIFIVIFSVGLVIGLLSAAAGPSDTASIVTGLLVIVAFFATPVFEAIIAKLFGNTPGKALFGLKPARVDGTPMTLGNLIGRNYRAYFFGMGLGLPIVSLIAMIVQFNNVRSKGGTGYDKGRYIMTETPIGLWRKVAAGIALALAVLLIVLVNVFAK